LENDSVVLEMSDAGEPRATPILVSDAEREHSIALLRAAVSEGRLTLEEFSERVGLACAARTDQQLARLGSTGVPPLPTVKQNSDCVGYPAVDRQAPAD
jgi:hypothetical protein